MNKKKKAKVVRDGGEKWILEIEGIDRPPWLYKDKVERSPMRGQVSIGSEMLVELKEVEKYGKKQLRIGRIFPLKGNANQGTKKRNHHQNKKSDFTFPKPAQSNENLYLKMFKQKRLFNDNYEFDDKDYQYNTNFQKSKFDTNLVEQINNNHIEQIKSLLGEDKVFSELVLSPEWRLSLGLGGTSVYETGLTLHHVYGIPFIPASAIKGIVRSYVTTEVYKNEVEALSKQDFCDVFGCNGEGKIGEDKKPFKSFYKKEAERLEKENDLGTRQGKVLFFDAFPQSTIKLEADIMNPHYPEWYKDGKTPPADWQSPVPIPFLTIGKDTKFQFVIGVKSDEHLPILEKAKTWLENALKEKGIGAKTAVGYGYMINS
ncbi:MAG: type III-B CRISPR module RAMP protein Cmr6 [Chitinophagales bacterium]